MKVKMLMANAYVILTNDIIMPRLLMHSISIVH